MTADEKIVKVIGDITELFQTVEKSCVPYDAWEHTYTTLRGIKGFWEGSSWDQIEAELKAEWITSARKDAEFKKFYILRKELDRLENLSGGKHK